MPKKIPKHASKTGAPPTRLDQVLKVITKTSEARGWSWTIDSIDDKKHTHAALTVSRDVTSGNISNTITALCEVTVNDGVTISMHKTSFYGYGVTELHEALVKELSKLPWVKKPEKQAAPPGAAAALPAPPTQFEPILRRFHQIARQLKRRHADRQTLTIADEYDVQDLLHAVLRGLYEDVRAEEATPSYAGSSSRVDFLLKAEKVVIEVKMANPKLRDKDIGEQLIIDMKRYSAHPDCKRLVCFVYDPDGHIKNPEGLEKDLSGKQGNIDVNVIVAPK